METMESEKNVLDFEEDEMVFESEKDEKLAEEFRCSICKDYLYKPLQNGQCGHVFCEKCIIDWRKERMQCPICHKTLETLIKSTLTKNIMQKITVKCVRCSVAQNMLSVKEHIENECPEGKCKCSVCKITIVRKELKNHTDICPHAIVPCEFPNCPDRMMRKNLSIHIAECVYKTMVCMCGEIIDLKHRKEHLMQCSAALTRIAERVMDYKSVTFNDVFFPNVSAKKLKAETCDITMFDVYKSAEAFLNVQQMYVFGNTIVFLTEKKNLILFPCMTVLLSNVSHVCQAANKTLFVIHTKNDQFMVSFLENSKEIRSWDIPCDAYDIVYHIFGVILILLSNNTLLFSKFSSIDFSSYPCPLLDSTALCAVERYSDDGDLNCYFFIETLTQRKKIGFTSEKKLLCDSPNQEFLSSYYGFQTRIMLKTSIRCLNKDKFKKTLKMNKNTTYVHETKYCGCLYLNTFANLWGFYWHKKTIGIFGGEEDLFISYKSSKNIVCACLFTDYIILLHNDGNIAVVSFLLLFGGSSYSYSYITFTEKIRQTAEIQPIY